MRNRVLIAAAALLLASATYAQAQQPAAGTSPVWGSIDFGARITGTTGDEARYERYRDLRDGVYSQIELFKSTDTFRADASATNVGYHDQKYTANYRASKVKFGFTWDSIPLNYSYESATPYQGPDLSGTTATYTLDPTVRQAVQDKVLVGLPANPSQFGQSIYDGLAVPFDLMQRRDTMNIGVAYDATHELGLDFGFTTTHKTGDQPFGASFAFVTGVEVPYPLDQRTNDFTVGMEWANQKGMFRVNYDASYFTNNVQTLIWDSPSNGPIDSTNSSGYSNGLGASRGRLALPPDNHQNVVSFTGLYKLPYHTVVNGMFAVTDQKQNGDLIPFTINTAITSRPDLYPLNLERTTAEAEVRGYNALFNFTSRPTKLVSLNARYRYNKHDNRTPMFNGEEYVRFDQVWEETGGETEQFDVTRNTFDVTATLNLPSYQAVRVGYGYDSADRTGRGFSGMTDNVFRLTYDALGNQYVTVRGQYEHVQRTGNGFSESAIEEGGAQPGLRFYDEADRDRNRGSVIVTAMPNQFVNVNVSFAGGKDTYKGEGHEFGLLNNSNQTVNFGVDVMPKDQIRFGMAYGRDVYKAEQKSRNANPPPDPSWTDPSRDWYLNNDETVNNFNLYLDVLHAIEKTDLRFNYEYSDSDNAFVHSGPRIDALAALGQFIALPDVTNKWQRFTVDAKYMMNEKVGLDIGYWYEKFDVNDFATIDTSGSVGYNAPTGTPSYTYLGGLILGYGNRPYTGNTGFLRVLYLF